MTPQLLSEVGLWLYGEQWQSQLARALNVSIRTVQRWASGEFNIKTGHIDDIKDIIMLKTNKGSRLIDKLDELRAEIKPD